MDGVSNSEVSRLREEIDEKVKPSPCRPPYPPAKANPARDAETYIEMNYLYIGHLYRVPASFRIPSNG